MVSANTNSAASKFKYNGKELQDELGLNTYDYGARFYDPATSRWFTPDALAEKYYDQSVYTYALNNPIIYIDPDGNQVAMCCKELVAIAKGYAQGLVNSVSKKVDSYVNIISNPKATLKTAVDNTPKTAEQAVEQVVMNEVENSNLGYGLNTLYKAYQGYQENGLEGATAAASERLWDKNIELAENMVGVGVAKVLSGVAKNSKWSKASQNTDGPGLRDHFDGHGADVGAKSVKDYDISARNTIQNGRKFTYKDKATGETRTGYYDSETGLFTATSKKGKYNIIHTHFKESWEKIKTWSGFSN